MPDLAHRHFKTVFTHPMKNFKAVCGPELYRYGAPEENFCQIFGVKGRLDPSAAA